MRDRTTPIIDGYSDLVPIGEGGFSDVYSAWDHDFNRRVAIKVLKTSDERALRRFDRERLAIGRLSDHPAILTPYSAGLTASNKPYLSMELVKAGSLAELINRTGPLPPTTAIPILLPAIDALGYAHRTGVLHRDIKPGNILVTSDGSRLTDFGIARVRGLTSTSKWLSLSYSPPEAFTDGDNRDERSDIYSMGATIYAALAGHAPFDRGGFGNDAAEMRRILEEQPAIIDGVPSALMTAVLQCLAKEPSQRPDSADDLHAELSGLAGRGVDAPTHPDRGSGNEASGLPPTRPRGAETTVPISSGIRLQQPQATRSAAARLDRLMTGIVRTQRKRPLASAGIVFLLVLSIISVAALVLT